MNIFIILFLLQKYYICIQARTLAEKVTVKNHLGGQCTILYITSYVIFFSLCKGVENLRAPRILHAFQIMINVLR